MSKLHVQMEHLMDKDTLHVVQDEVSLPFCRTVDKTRASLLIHQSVTLITSPAMVVCPKLYLCNCRSFCLLLSVTVHTVQSLVHSI